MRRLGAKLWTGGLFAVVASGTERGDRQWGGTKGVAEAKRKLAAILSADVVGYSRLMGDDEAATVETLKAYRAAVGRVIAQHGGHVVNAPGDNILADFPSAVGAVKAAVEIQKNIEGRNAELPE